MSAEARAVQELRLPLFGGERDGLDEASFAGFPELQGIAYCPGSCQQATSICTDIQTITADVWPTYCALDTVTRAQIPEFDLIH